MLSKLPLSIGQCVLLLYLLKHFSLSYNNNNYYCDKLTGTNNEFVTIEFSSTKDIVTCSFLNVQDTSRKSCSISYGPRLDMLIWSETDSSNMSNIPISLTAEAQQEANIFYVITASNSTFVVQVEGSLNLGERDLLSVIIITQY